MQQLTNRLFAQKIIFTNIYHVVMCRLQCFGILPGYKLTLFDGRLKHFEQSTVVLKLITFLNTEKLLEKLSVRYMTRHCLKHCDWLHAHPQQCFSYNLVFFKWRNFRPIRWIRWIGQNQNHTSTENNLVQWLRCLTAEQAIWVESLLKSLIFF